MRYASIALCLLALSACKTNPSGPTPRLNERFTLAIGHSVMVADTELRIGFRDVTGDSRCPADVVCIQGGDAVVHVRASGVGATADHELHTGDSSRAAVMHGPFRIELLELQPYPFSATPIKTADYRASFAVTRP